MKFKLIKQPTEELFDIFKSYCLKSKPFDFCELPSMQARLIKIKKYFNEMFLYDDCYIALKNDEIVSFYCIEKRDDIAEIIIAVGLYPKITFLEISKIFAEFRVFYKKQNPQIKTFKGEIYRSYKADSYLKFIKKYMGISRIDLDKEHIVVYFDD